MTEEKFDYKNEKECDVIISYINARFKKGLGTNIFVIGLSGSGKSSTSVRVGQKIQESRPEEDLKLFIVDSLLELLEAIKKSKKGDIIVVEEVSVLFPSRRAMAGDNVSIAKIFDTIRKKKLLIISNAPLWKSIDSHMKSMGHILILSIKVLLSEKVVVSKFYKLQTNPLSSKTYTHIMTRNGRDVPLLFTREPSKEVWDKYESDKDKFIDDLYEKERAKQIKKLEKENKALGLNTQPPKVKDLTTQELLVHKLYNIDKLKQQEIADKIGVCQQRVAKILQNIVKKNQIPKELSNTI